MAQPHDQYPRRRQIAAASLLEVAPLPYRQENYVTCLDFGAWAARCLSGLQAT
ncbi:hypothetical protein AB3X34_10795 [Raoultella terrigena]